MVPSILASIDPGKTGCCAVIYDGIIETVLFDEGFMHVYNFIKSRVLIHMMSGGKVFGVIEDVSPMPGEGAVGAFTFGKYCQMASDILEVLHIPFQFARPQKWQKGIGISMPTNKKAPDGCDAKTKRRIQGQNRTARKNHLIDTARRLFPTYLEGFNKTKTSGMADALLIATYAERLFNNSQVDKLPWEG